jgi:GT2 family glycosyltransferase
MRRASLSIVIPTYGRERVLIETLDHLRALAQPADEILVVDQTRQHEVETERDLKAREDAGYVRWIRLPTPSIPGAMNRGLLEARSELVLFLDDDVLPDPGLVDAHRRAHAEQGAPCGIVAGRVVQPWDDERTAGRAGFSFCQREPAWIEAFMGGNFSVPRSVALALGGFDAHFIGAAYRFEAEFAARMRAAGRHIRFEPAASLHHLHVGSGGTRTHGDHLRTWRPTHAVGAYYYLLRARPAGWWWRMMMRPWRAIRTRHHLRRPWWIVPTLVAELRGWFAAVRLRLRPPGTLPVTERSGREASPGAA